MAERYPWIRKSRLKALSQWAVTNHAERGHLLLTGVVVQPGQTKLGVREDELLNKGYLIKLADGSVVDAPGDNWECVPMNERTSLAPAVELEPELAPEPEPEPELSQDTEPELESEPESEEEPELEEEPGEGGS